jgi:uncharacterized membrane protein YqjE
MDFDSSYLGTSSTEAPISSMDALSRQARAVWTNAKGLVHDHAQLALLEVQRATLGLVKIIGAAVVISVLVVSAWMGLVAAGVVWAIGAGASWGMAIAIAAVLNLVAAGALAWWIKSQIPEVLFAATLRQLKGEPPAADDEARAKAANGEAHAQ